MTRLLSLCTLLTLSLMDSSSAATTTTTSYEQPKHEKAAFEKTSSSLWNTDNHIPRRQLPSTVRRLSTSNSKSTKASSSSSRSKGSSKKQDIACFTSAAEAGALGTMVLQSLWYEVLATQCDRLAMREKVFFKFFTQDVILQAANATVLADNREGLFQAWIDDLQTDCLAARDDGVVYNWQVASVVTEDGIHDDLVWQGQWTTSSGTSASSSYYFMIQLGGHRGGHSLLYGYQSSQRASPRQSECYEPVIYAMVDLGDGGSSTV